MTPIMEMKTDYVETDIETSERITKETSRLKKFLVVDLLLILYNVIATNTLLFLILMMLVLYVSWKVVQNERRVVLGYMCIVFAQIILYIILVARSRWYFVFCLIYYMVVFMYTIYYKVVTKLNFYSENREFSILPL